LLIDDRSSSVMTIDHRSPAITIDRIDVDHDRESIASLAIEFAIALAIAPTPPGLSPGGGAKRVAQSALWCRAQQLRRNTLSKKSL